MDEAEGVQWEGGAVVACRMVALERMATAAMGQSMWTPRKNHRARSAVGEGKR